MHLIKDENGNLIPHGHGDCQEHTHGEGHTHSHGSESCPAEGSQGHCGACASGGDAGKETVALLSYMLSHNEHHASELDQMAENLKKMGMEAAAKTIREAVSDFQKGNMRLGLALTLVKEELKQQ
ncbi:MAG: cobalt transporter [Clostridiales bacterium]|nr:cobalt transporter [Clostridiales bacterium]